MQSGVIPVAVALAIAVAIALAAPAAAQAVTITVPGDISVLATSRAGATVEYDVTARDADGGALVPTCEPAAGSAFPVGTTRVECGATDAAGGSASASFAVTVAPYGAIPRLIMPGDITVPAASPAGAVVAYDVSARDAAGRTIEATCRPASGLTFPVGEVQVRCRAVDAVRASASGYFTVTVTPYVDTVPPTITVPADMTVPAVSPAGANVAYAASATDNVDGSVTPTCEPPSASAFPVGETEVECRATDAAGNSATATFTITVSAYVDTVPPALTVPADMTVPATSPLGATVVYDAHARDNVDGALEPECEPPSGSTFPVGETEVECHVTDAAGHSDTASFTVTVSAYVDTVPPGIAVPESITVPADSPAGATVEYEATARDIVDGMIVPMCEPPSGSAFPVGETEVECQATDAAGNSSSVSFIITVTPYVDTVPPVIAVPNDIVVADGAAVQYAASARDNVDGDITPACSPPSGSAFGTGQTRVVCLASDAAGNEAISAFTVTVTPAGTPPTPPAITVPADMAVAATSPSGAVVAYAASARDAAGAAVAVECSPASGATFAVGHRTVRCSAADSEGNSARAQFAVTVRPFEPAPQAGERLFLEAFDSGLSRWTESGGPNWRAGAHEGPRNPDGTPASAHAASVAKADDCDAGCTLEMASPVDLSGRTGATLALTRYVDRTLDAGEHLRIDVHSGGAWTTAMEWTHGAGDDGVWHQESHDLAGHLSSDFKVRLVATTSTAGEDVAVDNVEVWATGGAPPEDAAAPVITVPAGVAAAATSAAGAAVGYAASASDAVDGHIAPVCRPQQGSTFTVGETRVTCTATDTARNTARAQFTVTVSPFVPAPQRGNLVFMEGFGAETAPWAESGSPNWTLGRHDGPRNPDGTATASSDNDVARADRCDADCTLTLLRTVDLSGRTGATMSLSRYVDRALDAGEYLKVEVHSDGAWTTAMAWTHGSGDDGQWRHVSHDLAGHLASDFKVRLVARASSVGEDVAVDDLAVWATG